MINEKLKTFIVLASERSYTKTAMICNLSQPAVTQHIQALEEEFDIKIFHRIGRDLILTPEGEILLRNAKRLIGINQNIRKEISESLTGQTHLDVGITLTASDYFIPEILNVYKQKYPGLSINFHTDILENIYERLKYLEFDFAIVDGGLDYHDFETHLLVMDRLILVTPIDHLFAKRESITFDELKQEKLILRHKTANTRMLFEHYLENNSDNIKNYNVILEIENISLIRHLVRDNHGVSIVSKKICLNDIINNRLKEVKIEGFNLERGIFLIHPKNSNKLEYIQDILKLKIRDV